MNIAEALAQAADQECVRFERAGLRAEQEMAEVEKQKAKLNSQINTAKLASQRLLNFPIKVGVDYQCPRCWIANETRSALRAIDGDDSRDLMECRACGFVLEIPIGI